MTIDDEALSYIALAAESRIRSLLSSSISAQTHRTSSSHFREPPLQTSPSSSSSGKPAKPMWSHRVTSDANAVLDALSRANKDAEQSFRASRMDRLAHETELARARERVEKAVEAETGSGSSFGPSTNEISPVTAHGNGTPVFGTVAEKKGTKKAGKKAARDVSAEVQHKMSNAMAMRSAGVSKKYSWLTSVPNVSSPLAGRKRKAGQEGAAEAPGAMTAEAGEAATKAGDGREKSRGKGKERNGEGGQQFKGLSEVHEDETPTKRLRSGLVLSAPTRRLVLVDRNSLGQERRIQDNRVVTMMDLLFAMERDGLGKGMGTADEIFRRVWAIGGYWKDTGNKGRG